MKRRSIKLKKNFPKWIDPKKRMPRYQDYGILDPTPSNSHLWKKIKWCDFIIVCKAGKDRAQIRAAMEYFHDFIDIGTDHVVVNQLVHNYLHGDESDKHTDVIVDKELYDKLEPRKHLKKRQPYKYEKI